MLFCGNVAKRSFIFKQLLIVNICVLVRSLRQLKKQGGTVCKTSTLCTHYTRTTSHVFVHAAAVHIDLKWKTIEDYAVVLPEITSWEKRHTSLMLNSTPLGT